MNFAVSCSSVYLLSGSRQTNQALTSYGASCNDTAWCRRLGAPPFTPGSLRINTSNTGLPVGLAVGAGGARGSSERLMLDALLTFISAMSLGLNTRPVHLRGAAEEEQRHTVSLGSRGSGFRVAGSTHNQLTVGQPM